MEEAKGFCARLKPWKKGKYGHRCKSYRIYGIAFKLDKWYEVSEATAYHLRQIRVDSYDDETPRIFQVVTLEEAQTLEDAEIERASKAHRKAHRAKKVVTTLDVAAPSEREPVIGYSTWNVNRVMIALREMTAEQLEQTLMYEMSHQKRVTVKREVVRRMSME